MALIETRALRSRFGTREELDQAAEAGRLYAVLDACDAPAVPARALELGKERAVSLYQGGPQEDYWDVAPYLARVDAAVLDWILNALWDQPWGLFAYSTASLEELRTHFRHFLMVRSPEGEHWYFRFYDPRVFVRILPTFQAGELRAFFGPARAYGTTDPETKALMWIGPRPDLPFEPEAPRHSGKGPLLALRPEQLVVFQPVVEQDFETRLAAHLRKEHAAAVGDLPDPVLAERIHAGLARARSHGLTRESALAIFVALMFEFAPNFDEWPPIQRLLTEPDVPPDDRIDLLTEEATEEDWIEVERRSDQKAWSAPPLQRLPGQATR